MPEKQQIAPTFAKMLDDRGYVTKEWHRWFQKLKVIDDTVKKIPYITVTESTQLTTRDLGKSILFNIGTTDAICYLPSVGSNDIGSWITIMRGGTGRLTIVAADSDKIEYSSTPGSIFCNELKRYAANVTLQLMTETQWAVIGATGIWKIA